MRAIRRAGVLPGPPMPWQDVAVIRSLETSAGRPWRHTGVVAGRGNGKSAIAGGISWAHLVSGRSVLVIAHNLATAKDVFDVVDATIDADPRMKSRVLRRLRGKGDAKLVVAGPGGTAPGILRIGASERAVRGPRARVIVADESGEVTEPVWAAARYVQQGLGAGVVPLDVRLGTVPGDPDSASPLSQLRAQAALGDPGTLWLEWSIPLDADPHDESLWPLAIPALGHRVDIDEVRQEIAADPLTAAVELLSRWPTTAVTRRIPEDWWRATADPDVDQPAPGEMWLGVDVDGDDRDDVAIVGAWIRPDGHVHMELLHVVPVPDLHPWLDSCRDKWDPRGVVYDPYVAQSIAADATTPGWWVPIGVRDLVAGAARVHDRLRAGTLHHTPDPVLDRAAAADARPLGGAWTWRRTPTTVPLIAATLAVHGLLSTPRGVLV